MAHILIPKFPDLGVDFKPKEDSHQYAYEEIK